MKKCYIADDDGIILLVTQKFIEKQSYFDKVEGFLNGKLLVEALKKEASSLAIRDSLVFLDINMPVSDGWDVLDILRADKELSNIPVVILTSSVDTIDKRKAEEYPNIFRYVVKPMSIQEISEIVGFFRQKTM